MKAPVQLSRTFNVKYMLESLCICYRALLWNGLSVLKLKSHAKVSMKLAAGSLQPCACFLINAYIILSSFLVKEKS